MITEFRIPRIGSRPIRKIMPADVLAAAKLAPLVFVRLGELREAKWCEINFEIAEWRIPARKIKMREIHIVPLSLGGLPRCAAN